MKKLLLLMVFVLLSGSAFAQERIVRFVSSVWVNKDASVAVQEEISVWADHQKIRRGIYRDLPNTAQEPVEIVSLEMDGAPHPYSVERRGDNLRINFGNSDYVSRGLHTYRLRYKMENVVRFFPQYDELYWNVTGNGWDFDIDQVFFDLHLPPEARVDVGRISSYIGYYGEQGPAAWRHELVFWTDRPLAPKEGLTVAVPWQKGVVLEPKYSWFKKNAKSAHWLFTGLILFVLGVYYYVSWRRVGKEPRARVIRRFDPPEGFSAAMTGYVYDRGCSGDLFSITLTSLAVKGALKIEENEAKYVLRLQNKEAPLLSEEEKRVLNALFYGRTEVSLSEKNRLILARAEEELSLYLTEKAKNIYFVKNAKYNLPTLAALLCFVLLNLTQLKNAWLLFLAVFVFLSSYMFASAHKKGFLGWLMYLMGMAVFCVMAFVLITPVNWALCSGIILTAVFGGWFAHWIEAYTPLGRSKMDEIEGFKQYLEIGEGGRVAASNPAQAAQIFCDYLPYAYVLGVQSKWMAAFQQRLDEATLVQTMHERGLYVANPAAVSGAIYACRAATQTSSSSSTSSGSGGGGFSGGGSGGGGGGGR